MYKEYRKTATVKAKLFEKGDETGFVHRDGILGAMEDSRYGLKPDLVPYITTLENQCHHGEFGKHYLCVGVKGEKWLVDKDIFEETYELAATPTTAGNKLKYKTMTPKEKANELVQKFRLLQGSSQDEDGTIVNNYNISKHNARQCAIIAVEDILSVDPIYPSADIYYELLSDRVDDAKDFWQSVLSELRTLA